MNSDIRLNCAEVTCVSLEMVGHTESAGSLELSRCSCQILNQTTHCRAHTAFAIEAFLKWLYNSLTALKCSWRCSIVRVWRDDRSLSLIASTTCAQTQKNMNAQCGCMCAKTEHPFNKHRTTSQKNTTMRGNIMSFKRATFYMRRLCWSELSWLGIHFIHTSLELSIFWSFNLARWKNKPRSV